MIIKHSTVCINGGPHENTKPVAKRQKKRKETRLKAFSNSVAAGRWNVVQQRAAVPVVQLTGARGVEGLEDRRDGEEPRVRLMKPCGGS